MIFILESYTEFIELYTSDVILHEIFKVPEPVTTLEN